jgi:hypothetical protein
LPTPPGPVNVVTEEEVMDRATDAIERQWLEELPVGLQTARLQAVQ